MEGRFLLRINRRRENFSRFGVLATNNRDASLNLTSIFDSEKAKIAEFTNKRTKSLKEASEITAQADADVRQFQTMVDGGIAVHNYDKVNREITTHTRRFIEQTLAKDWVMEAFQPDKDYNGPPNSDDALRTSKIYIRTGLSPEIMRQVKDKEVHRMNKTSLAVLENALYDLAKDRAKIWRIKAKVQQIIDQDPNQAQFRHQLEDRLYMETLQKKKQGIVKELREGRDERDKEEKLVESQRENAELKEQLKILKNNKELSDHHNMQRAVIAKEAKDEAQQIVDQKTAEIQEKLQNVKDQYAKDLEIIQENKKNDIEKVRMEHNNKLELLKKDYDHLHKSFMEVNKARQEELAENEVIEPDEKDIIYRENDMDIDIIEDDSSDGEDHSRPARMDNMNKETQRMRQHTAVLRKKKEAEVKKASENLKKLMNKKETRRRKKRSKKYRNGKEYSRISIRKRGDGAMFSSSDDDYFSEDDDESIDLNEKLIKDDQNNVIGEYNNKSVNLNKKMINDKLNGMDLYGTRQPINHKQPQFLEDQVLKRQIAHTQGRYPDGTHIEGMTNGKYCWNEYCCNYLISCFNWIGCGHYNKRPVHLPDEKVPLIQQNYPRNYPGKSQMMPTIGPNASYLPISNNNYLKKVYN